MKKRVKRPFDELKKIMKIKKIRKTKENNGNNKIVSRDKSHSSQLLENKRETFLKKHINFTETNDQQYKYKKKNNKILRKKENTKRI